ncbi:alkene reductase [Cupriavidus numazuensis]|uniref:N-ethylmaleimide reductase n=1 Tax=Cupriavidus numazuensis TaxID=221992 RepID=A0ABN7QC33_9BURK|nr:alkene reductase [Cupriavidus numazuensis]CAG2161244.1 N-ethylmaleimide reductase [Cupriavidus numazuensis]
MKPVSIFDPLVVGELELPNRIIMAPLTRLRAPGLVPNDMMALHYKQRASAGLIISEGVPVMPEAVGYPHVPGIWSPGQIEGWRKVTDAVHNAGGRIFAQIWHVGRISDPSRIEGGLTPVAPTAIAPDGHLAHSRPKMPYGVPRELSLAEIKQRVEAFRLAAINALQAGFDGVTIHGANGYLLDQFLQDGSNHRDDEYGGSIENRARLLLEVADAVSSVWGAESVGMHLAPGSPSHSVSDSDPSATFGYVARELGKRKLAFLFVREPESEGALLPVIRREFGGLCVANDGFDIESAKEVVASGKADAVAFGRAYMANPDLVERLRLGAPLNKLIPETIFDIDSCGPTGYLDYPVLGAAA